MNHISLQSTANILRTEEFSAFAQIFRAAFLKNDRVNLTGTGEAGHLAIRLERAWRKAVLGLMEKYPQAVPVLEQQLPYFRHIDMAGEYSIIDTPDCLPQSNIYGRGMMRASGVASAGRDSVICLDPAGDTPSTLGSAHFALIHLAPMYILTCEKPDAEKNGRTKEVYTHPNCRVLTVADLPAMELLCAVAVEAALWDLLETVGVPNAFPGFAWFAHQLEALQVAPLTGKETTLLSDEYLLNALCFAAEHPQFRAKNPSRETKDAWEHCFLRQPRCLNWTADFYQSLGFSNAQIQSIPDISADALMQIPIGKESFAGNGLNLDAALAEYDLPQTQLDIFQNLTVNLLLDSLAN